MIAIGNQSEADEKRRLRDLISYEIGILDWNWEYHFGRPLSQPRRSEVVFEQSSSFHLVGRFLSPSALVAKPAQVRLFIADIDLNHRRTDGGRDIAGMLEGPKANLHVTILLPLDREKDLLIGLNSGRVKRLILFGTPLERKRAEIEAYSFGPVQDAEA